MTSPSELGRRIHNLRKARGLSQQALADTFGISAQAVSKWENGDAMPDLAIIPDLCRTLGVSSDAMLAVPADISADRVLAQLHDLFPRMTTMERLSLVQRVIDLAIRTGESSSGTTAETSRDRSALVSSDSGLLFRHASGMGAVMRAECEDNFRAHAESTLLHETLDLLCARDGRRVLMALGIASPATSEQLAKSLGIPSDRVEQIILRWFEFGYVTADESGYALSPERGWLAHLALAILMASQGVLGKITTCHG